MSMEIYKNGWENVPEHLKTKTQLSKMGLKTKEDAVARIESYYNTYDLYDVNQAVPKRKMSDKQAKSLEEARLKSLESNRCDDCKNVYLGKHLIREEDSKRCRQCERYHQELMARKEEIEEGENIFKEWFQEDFLILDTETTGLYTSDDIVEISIIDRHGNVLLDTLLKPYKPIPKEAIDIHGITNEMVENAPSFRDIYPTLKRILEGKKVLIYNAAYDKPMICSAIYRNELEYISFEVDCVMESYMMANGNSRWVKLSDASGRYSGHRALYDCFSTLKVVQDMWKELDLL